MSQESPPSGLLRPAYRRLAPILPLFLIFIVVLLVANSINRTAREEMIAHFQRQQDVLAKQFALGMEELVQNTSRALTRMGKNVSRLPILDPHVIEELEITWDILGGGGFVVMLELKDAEGTTINRHSTVEAPFDRGPIGDVHAKVMEGRVPVVSDIVTVGGDRHFIYIGVPILDAEGEVTGELGALISVTRLMERAFTALEQEEIGAYWILTETGVVVYHSSHPEMMLRNIFEADAECRDCHDDFSVEEAMTQGSDGQGRTMVSGEEKLVSFASIRVEDKLWSIAISDPVDKATRPFSESAGQFMIFTLALVVLIFVAGLFVLRAGRRTARAEEKALTSARLLRAAEEEERLNRELEQANRMAVLGEMVARVAHEIKNPIQYMGTGFGLLKHEADAEERERIIEDIGEGLTSLEAIVQELLNFARPMKLELFPTDIKELVDDAVAHVPDGVVVRIDVDDGFPEVPLDGVKSKQLLTNLVDNAVAAMEGEGTLTILARTVGELVELRVSDTGKGIAAANMEHIFTPFYTTRSKGVGLGMSVVQRIVDLHQGVVEVSSELGRGTEFTIRIPRNLG